MSLPFTAYLFGTLPQFATVLFIRSFKQAAGNTTHLKIVMGLLENFIQFNKKQHLFQPKDKLLLAVSGGIDSVVLCALCKEAGNNFAIAHCNFKLRGADSDSDEKFVQQLAETYKVPFYVTSFDTATIAATKKKSIEEAARDLRYEWFAAIAKEHTFQFILTAHHADDTIETVTMNFFRGTGIKGLRGILPKHGNIVRPLLFARRTELEAFVQTKNLAFVTDHTNAENDYTRNYFRNEILPLVSKSFPQAKDNILKNIQRFTETEILYQQAIDIHIKKLIAHKGNEVHIPVLKLLKVIPLATVMYEIIKEYGFTAHQADEALLLLQRETGKYVSSATHRIIKNRQWLIIAPVLNTEAQNILVEEKDASIIFEAGELQLEMRDAITFEPIANNLVATLDAAEITFPLLLRKWKMGDYFYPLGMKKKKKLNRFLNDIKLSLTQKENTWVLEMDKKIIWVVGLRIDDRFKVAPSTKNILTISYQPK